MIPILAQTAAEPSIAMRPFLVLAVSVVFIVVAITKWKMHPFLSLMCAALLAGWMSSNNFAEMVEATQEVSAGFGRTAGGVGLVIALAAIIGMCLMDSGAADQIVRRFMKIFGEKNAGWALLASGFFLSIPVFFDTVFFLLIPLARMLGLRTGKQYLYYVMAICAGGAVTHSIVPPTPGPLLVGGLLGLDLGTIMVAGFIAGILPAVGALYFARAVDLKLPIPVRATEGSSMEDLKSSIGKKDEELPSFFASILPVVLPALLLAAFSFVDMMEKNQIKTRIATELTANAIPAEIMSQGQQAVLAAEITEAQNAALNDPESYSGMHALLQFFGEKVIALGIGALISILILLKQKGLNLPKMGEKWDGPLMTAGVIILITSAGGAFGAMIRASGIGDSITAFGQGQDFDHAYILLAWFITALIRIAQGSATVSMITGAGLMSAVLASGVDLSYHELYIFLAIGFGSITCSWMNDSGFWIVCKLSGFTEKETLKTWTPMLTIIALIGLVETFLFSYILPFGS